MRYRDSAAHSQDGSTASIETQHQALSMAFESDRGRVLNSAAVRRLQQKTQVFPLEKNAAVRSRLTHSLEVMQVGRHIVKTICSTASKELSQQYLLATSERQLETVVEMACILHDVGNPPFGHFGEHAISEWFNQHALAYYQQGDPHELSANEQALFADVSHFEGNAQAIRLVHHLMGLNLSNSLVASILKYTRCGTDPKPSKDHPLYYLQKKVGYYFSEQNAVSAIQASLNVQDLHRHPATYIMEAADDISYCMADLEDAVVKGIISVDQLQRALITEYAKVIKEFEIGEAAENHQAPEQAATYSDVSVNDKMTFVCARAKEAYDNEDVSKDNAFFVSFRVAIVHPLVMHASQRFLHHIEAITEGSFNQALLEDRSAEHALSLTLKNVALKHVFCVKEVETIELQGYQILHGLFDKLSVLLQLSASEFMQVCKQEKGFALASRLVKRLDKKHLSHYIRTIEDIEKNGLVAHTKVSETDLPFSTVEYYYRCRLIQDHVSGMTDQNSLDEYRLLFAV